jgi:hypothetical protein
VDINEKRRCDNASKKGTKTDDDPTAQKGQKIKTQALDRCKGDEAE